MYSLCDAYVGNTATTFVSAVPCSLCVCAKVLLPPWRSPRGGRRARLIYVMLGVVLTFVIASRSECRFTNEKSVMAEGVGLSPTICKALKINARFRSYVVQDYRTSVPSGKGVFLIRNSIRSQKSPGVPDRTAKAHKLSLDSKSA
jgi:hypothetical protein